MIKDVRPTVARAEWVAPRVITLRANDAANRNGSRGSDGSQFTS